MGTLFRSYGTHGAGQVAPLAFRVSARQEQILRCAGNDKLNRDDGRSKGAMHSGWSGFKVARLAQAALLVCAMTLLLGAGDPEARFKDLGHHMMCTCGCGQVLLECNHVGCQSSDRMRVELATALGMTNGGSGGGPSGDGGASPEGGSGSASDDAIYKWFAQKYGQTVIAAPATTGFSRIAWVMPFLLLVLGIAGLVLLVRAWKNRPAPAIAGGISLPTGPELDRFREQARKETDL
jgi:Cytochrome C biogenesis protein